MEVPCADQVLRWRHRSCTRPRCGRRSRAKSVATKRAGRSTSGCGVAMYAKRNCSRTMKPILIVNGARSAALNFSENFAVRRRVPSRRAYRSRSTQRKGLSVENLGTNSYIGCRWRVTAENNGFLVIGKRYRVNLPLLKE
jgi:hypothetical protein